MSSPSWRHPDKRPTWRLGGPPPALRACVVAVPFRFAVAGWLGAGVPNSMGSYTQGGRYVSGLALAPYLVNWTAAPACVGSTAVTRFLVAAWARAGGRDMPGYWWLGDSPPVTYGCAVLSPSPPWSRWLGDSSSGLGGLRWRRARKLAAGRSHPHPWAFLVLVPGLRQGSAGAGVASSAPCGDRHAAPHMHMRIAGMQAPSVWSLEAPVRAL